jgi:hypothetical protein
VRSECKRFSFNINARINKEQNVINLFLHCGGHHVDRDAIEKVRTPASTPSWVPVPHHRVLEEVETALVSAKLSIVNQAHALWGNGQRYFALLEVCNGKSSGDHALIVGVRNSHDQSFPASIALGNGVFVCDNLSFSGEVTISRRHTRYIERDLPRVIHTAVGRLTDLRKQQDERIDSYKATTLSDTTAHDLLVRAIDAGAVPVTQLPAVLSEWRDPSHEEFSMDGRTAWRLFNAVTSVWKGRSLSALPRRSQALHGLLDAACGLAV